MENNALITFIGPYGYVVSTNNGLSGLLDTDESFVVGDSINVDIKNVLTVEYLDGFWGPLFKVVNDNYKFWEKNLNENFEVKFEKGKLILIAKSYKISLYEQNFNEIDFYLEGNGVVYDDFKKSINIGNFSNNVNILLCYELRPEPSETSLLKVLEISSKMNEM